MIDRSELIFKVIRNTRILYQFIVIKGYHSFKEVADKQSIKRSIQK